VRTRDARRRRERCRFVRKTERSSSSGRRRLKLERIANQTFVAVRDPRGLLLYVVVGAYDEAGFEATRMLIVESGWMPGSGLLIVVCVHPEAPLVDRETVKRWSRIMAEAEVEATVHLTAIMEPGMRGNAMRAFTRLFEILNPQRSAKRITGDPYRELHWVCDELRRRNWFTGDRPVGQEGIARWLDQAILLADVPGVRPRAPGSGPLGPAG